MGSRAFKDALYGQFARVSKSLGHPRRLELIDLLAQGERPVEALARETGMSVASTSQHLQVLREACLVEARKDGLYVYYRLANPAVFSLLQGVRGVAEAQLADVRRVVDTYLGGRDGMAPVGREELLERARSGEVLVLDVRPAEEYAAGHIAGALSIPISELEARLKELPKRREVVAYCRGPYCVYADEAVKLLRGSGRKARRLHEGFPEWRAAGLPTSTVRRA
ncbi:metalloregulator ArsR/SmtB family transcription factor [Myxococcus sp. RHSTA-1-4]|uniref:ArsR/SmtB family transcription factor n=1 Tax=Myxococcus sp. RHSTA-1-4 TaxID=2874601 RepID=UPI001CBE0E44|nr:metalloregulator ArsR/SmtB family transcription factor [Myxococcus sp. RHSTA-1-4]MBZ4416127.1 metalloregulator ArsR/SmtB family transcription factor [Myxococcus sp. RHSTA-1-4]